MTWLWLRQIDAQLRAFVPFLTALCAAMLDQLPLPGPGLEAVGSFVTLGVVYFWSLYRADLLTPTAAFVAGVVFDALAGLPPGGTPLLLLLVRNLMVTQQRFFLARPFPVIWACFMLLAPVAMGLRWLILCLWWGHLFDLRPVLFELVLTVALYPALSWLLSRIHNHVPRLIYAP
jgi:rod shape-determining protein MreD